MPVQINITGEDANQAIEEFAILSAAFTGVQAPTVQPTPQEDKPKRNRTTAPKPEPKEDPNPDKVSNEVQEDGKKLIFLVCLSCGKLLQVLAQHQKLKPRSRRCWISTKPVIFPLFLMIKKSDFSQP